MEGESLALTWAMATEIKRGYLHFNCVVLCSLLAQTWALNSKSYCPLLTPLCSFTVNLFLTGRLSSAVPALGE